MAMTHAELHDVLVEQLDAHVREVVRREGVDPQRDAPVVRRIAESVVRDHDERSQTGVVAPVPDVYAGVGDASSGHQLYGDDGWCRGCGTPLVEQLGFPPH